MNKLKILKAFIPLAILGVVVLLSNVDFTSADLGEPLAFKGTVKKVEEEKITLETGRIIYLSDNTKFNSTVEGYEMDNTIEPGNYLYGNYTTVGNDDIIEEININVAPEFKGVITELEGYKAVVKVNEGESYVLSAADLVYVALPEELTFAIGDEITVRFDGSLNESYPLQIVTVSVNGTIVN